jgi:hypothetical protein
MPKCEVHLHVAKHLLSLRYRTRCILAFGRELSDTCQIAACQALTDICQDYEAKVDNTHARFFPVMDQTYPNMNDKVEAMEKVGQQTPEYTIVSTVRYLHALDTLYEHQH